jgi:hypothetical protein
MSEQFVIRLKDGRYWISHQATASHIAAAAKYESRWTALAEMAKAGPIMHEAAIVAYRRPEPDAG